MKIYYQRSEFNPNWEKEGSQWMTRSVIVDEAGEYQASLPETGTFVFINHNGSKWAGQTPDPIEALYKMLEEHPLNPDFEKYGNFISKPGTVNRIGFLKFWGNFAEISHGFDIETNDRQVIDDLVALITANQSSPEYRRIRAERL